MDNVSSAKDSTIEYVYISFPLKIPAIPAHSQRQSSRGFPVPEEQAFGAKCLVADI